MEILNKNAQNLQNAALILGFFDGIHLGHREVISSAVNYAKTKGQRTVLLTFDKSPSEYFRHAAEYIYPRAYSYKLIENLGADCIIENKFEDLANIKAEDFLKSIVEIYRPISISTGFNHTFGKHKEGNNSTLMEGANRYGYKYFLCPPIKFKNQTVSSTYIKELLAQGNTEAANTMLSEPFTLEGEVVYGEQLGRKLGFPTANIEYPSKIIRLPYGVYKSEVLGHKAVLNWGIKPTVNGKKEGLEVHILDFNENLYGQILSVKILKKIRDEQKFENQNKLKEQIKKDTEECLK